MASTRPAVAVVIPTYNRCDLLRRTLASLAAQRLPAGEFEVIVADDGSSDATADVVDAYRGRLRLGYHFQEDRGFRAAAARNGGARLATAPILAFLDSGTVAGPDFVRGHRDAHLDRRRAIVGYIYGYRPWEPMPGLDRLLAEHEPEEVVERCRDEPLFRDARHDEMAAAGFDISRRAAPWMFLWSANFSVGAGDFWAVGGFQEDFRSWGVEDLELGYRLFRHGVPFQLSREAWAIEIPHDRIDPAANIEANKLNAHTFLEKHPEPMGEVFWATFMREQYWPVETEGRALEAWTRAARDLDVRAEIAEAVRGAPPDARIAVFGSGGCVPADPPCTLVEFDAELLTRAVESGPHAGHHAIGVRTPLPDRSFDLVVVTSRLRGLWDAWAEDILTEARRIGREVRGPLVVG